MTEKSIVLWDDSISFARLIAMCFIVLCHMMQQDGFSSDIQGGHIEWAYWFNVGVQMFLFISGYLQGKKTRIETISFYSKNFPKLLVDYYIFVAAMLVLIACSSRMKIDSRGAIGLLTFSGTVSGLGHLWFIPTILFCYLLTPPFSEIVQAIDKRSDKRFWIEAAVLILIIHVVVDRLFGKFEPAWINCFVIGMLFARLEERKKRSGKFNSERAFIVVILSLCILIIPLQFRFDYWPHRELPIIFTSQYKHFKNDGHLVLGIVLVLLSRALYKSGKLQKSYYLKEALKWSDKYSYDVYLTHHVFVQSAFACVKYIDRRWIALPLAVLLTIFSSVVLHKASQQIREKCSIAFRKMPD